MLTGAFQKTEYRGLCRRTSYPTDEHNFPRLWRQIFEFTRPTGLLLNAWAFLSHSHLGSRNFMQRDGALLRQVVNERAHRAVLNP